MSVGAAGPFASAGPAGAFSPAGPAEAPAPATAIVVVSHSRRLAEGVAEIASQMAPGVVVRGVGGLGDGLGTDAWAVRGAVADLLDAGHQVLLTADLGSALMVAEIVVEEEVRPVAGRCALTVDCPVVRGTLAAAVTARAGGDAASCARAAARTAADWPAGPAAADWPVADWPAPAGCGRGAHSGRGAGNGPDAADAAGPAAEPDAADTTDPADAGERAPSRDLEPRRASADSPQTGALALFGRRDVEPAARQSGRGRDRVVSSGLTERLSERRRALRTLRLHRLGTALGLLGAAAVLVWAVAFSPLLALRSGDVTVTGSDGTVQAADVQRIVAAHEGISLVRLDPAAVGREVADSLVRVRTARVTRSWPHGVRVDLTMRRPIAVHEVEQGYEVLDSEAVVLETVPAPPSGLVTIAGQDGAEPDARAVSAVTGVVGSLDAETLARVARGSAGATGQVTLVLSDGARVRWGDASESALKARVLKVLLSQRASVYDVSSPHAPTTS